LFIKHSTNNLNIPQYEPSNCAQFIISMINWDGEGGGDLTKFLRSNKAKREEKI
jgi:hypothetical protein